jgi:hypothetical protein
VGGGVWNVTQGNVGIREQARKNRPIDIQDIRYFEKRYPDAITA